MSELSKEILNRVVLPEVLHEQDPEKRPIFRPEAAAKAAKARRTLMSVEESCVRNTVFPVASRDMICIAALWHVCIWHCLLGEKTGKFKEGR
jgi:hypothetical protein